MFKKIVSLFFLFVVLVGTLTACKSTSVLPPTKTEVTNTVTIKEVVRDTIFEIQKDSSFYKAWLECQSPLTPEGGIVPGGKSKIVLRNLKTKSGKYLKPPKVSIIDNILTIDCEAEAQKLFAKWKDIYKIENMQSVITNTVEVERQLTFWQKFQIWCGRLFIVIALFTAGKIIFKIYKPL
jgi:hypothetical protein